MLLPAPLSPVSHGKPNICSLPLVPYRKSLIDSDMERMVYLEEPLFWRFKAVTHRIPLFHSHSVGVLIANVSVLRSDSATPLVRGKATTAAAPPKAGSFKDMNMKVWTSDPGAYPIIGILGIACVGCSIYGTHHLFFCNDVQISKNKRESVIRTWGK